MQILDYILKLVSPVIGVVILFSLFIYRNNLKEIWDELERLKENIRENTIDRKECFKEMASDIDKINDRIDVLIRK